MSLLPKKAAIISIATIGLFLMAEGCGSPQSDRSNKGATPAKGQIQAQPARILTNQVGYEPAGAKRAVVQGHAGDTFTAFAVKSYPGAEVVLSGIPIHVGPVAKWKDWDFWTIDWTAVDKEGTYV
ncbi:MAG: cellulase N-terminal Ig-like domain-containing protein, partial [Candidatus Aminicenantales bacterium]